MILYYLAQFKGIVILLSKFLSMYFSDQFDVTNVDVCYTNMYKKCPQTYAYFIVLHPFHYFVFIDYSLIIFYKNWK